MRGDAWSSITVRLIRNSLTVFAVVYVTIHSLTDQSGKSHLVVGRSEASDLSSQDIAFSEKCRLYQEKSALRRNHCDDPPAQFCENICIALGKNLSYYEKLWPNSLLAACDRTCALYQSSICNGGVSYAQLCDETARTRVNMLASDQLQVTVQDDRGHPSFFSLILLIFVAASDILVSIAEYKAKYLVAPTDEAALYDASQLDATAALIGQILRAAEQPEHLLTVAKTSFEIRCLLFDNSCDQALQLIVIFQLCSLVWNARGSASRFLPALRLDIQQRSDEENEPSSKETEGHFQEAPVPTRSRNSSKEFIKTQSMAEFTQDDTSKPESARTDSSERTKLSAQSPPQSATSTVTNSSAFGKLGRLMGK